MNTQTKVDVSGLTKIKASLRDFLGARPSGHFCTGRLADEIGVPTAIVAQALRELLFQGVVETREVLAGQANWRIR